MENRPVTWLQLAEMYNSIQSERKKYELQEKKLKEQMIALQDGKSYTEDRYALDISFKKGSVQYANIPELKDVDIDKYRSEDISLWTFKRLY